MIHASPIIAASDVVVLHLGQESRCQHKGEYRQPDQHIAQKSHSHLRAPRPAVLNTTVLAVASSIEQAGDTPLNPLIGFIFPSNPPRSRVDWATVVALSFIVANCAVGIAIADAVFR